MSVRRATLDLGLPALHLTTHVHGHGASMSFLQDVKLRPNYIYIKKTNARIPLKPWFIKEFSIGYLFFLYIQAVRVRRLAMMDYKRPVLHFYPQRPRPWYMMWNICKYAGFRITDNPDRADVLVHFEDSATSDDEPVLRDSGRPIYNGDLLDIRKSEVARAFEDAFGYPFLLDPTIHRGRALRKSEGNGRHDGHVEICPIDRAEPDHVYQRLVNNSDDGVTVEDLRLSVVGDKLPLVYRKTRVMEERFTNLNNSVELLDPADVFSEKECEQLLQMARKIGMDFGTFDTLRDRDDGRLYVVDANKTEMGPPINMAMKDKFEAMHRYSEAYTELFMNGFR
jgi:hypothetical protein